MKLISRLTLIILSMLCITTHAKPLLSPYISGGSLKAEGAPIKALTQFETGRFNIINESNHTIYMGLRDLKTNRLIEYRCDHGSNPYCQFPYYGGVTGEQVLHTDPYSKAELNVVIFSDPMHRNRLAEFYPVHNYACLYIIETRGELSFQQSDDCA